MRARITTVAAVLLALLGAVHVAYTFVEHSSLTARAIWFAGAGIALIAIAAMNLLATVGHASRWILRAVNLLGLAYAVAAAIALSIPQAFLGVVLTAVLSIASMMRRAPS